MACISIQYLPKHDINVPCGKCGFCLAQRRSDWSTRIDFESKLWTDAKFITLTYADPHLHWRNGISQLHKPHYQKYLKVLRKTPTGRMIEKVCKKTGKVRIVPEYYKLRYYLVGEYGSTTFRPHYHVILFSNVPENVLRDAWKYGQIHIGTVTQGSIMYCLKYIVNGRAKGMRNGRVAPFASMSRKPGIGANYLSKEMIAWHKSGRKNYVEIQGEKRHLPRYYKEKIFSKIDRVRIAVRDQKAAFEKLRAELKKINVKVSKRYPLGALSYHDHQMRIAEKRIRDKTKEKLTI